MTTKDRRSWEEVLFKKTVGVVARSMEELRSVTELTRQMCRLKSRFARMKLKRLDEHVEPS